MISKVKTINRISFVVSIITLLLFSSCNDWLDINTDESLLKEEFWIKKEYLISEVSGAYNSLKGTIKTHFMMGEVRADNFVATSNSTLIKLRDGNITSDNDFAKWTSFYSTINYCNSVIDNMHITIAEDHTFSEEEQNLYKAEMLAMRAFLYFKMTQIWRDIPLQLTVVESDGDNLSPSKSTQAEVLAQVLADLLEAERIYPLDFDWNTSEEYEIENRKGRIGIWAIKAILADVYLEMDNATDCLVKCDEIIESNKFAIMTDYIEGDEIEEGTSAWFSNFDPGNSNESIWELQYSSDLGQSNNFNQFTTFGTSNSDNDLSISYELAYSFYIGVELDNRFSLGTSGTYGSLLKYGVRTDANWIYYRLSEIDFMKAEALIMLGGTDNFFEVFDIINKHRAKVGSAEMVWPNSEDPTYWYKVLLREKNCDFFGEAKRWFDLHRIASRNDWENKDFVIDLLLEGIYIGSQPVLKVKYSYEDFWYMPIHTSELNLNVNLVQNEYYD